MGIRTGGGDFTGVKQSDVAAIAAVGIATDSAICVCISARTVTVVTASPRDCIARGAARIPAPIGAAGNTRKHNAVGTPVTGSDVASVKDFDIPTIPGEALVTGPAIGGCGAPLATIVVASITCRRAPTITAQAAIASARAAENIDAIRRIAESGDVPVTSNVNEAPVARSSFAPITTIGGRAAAVTAGTIATARAAIPSDRDTGATAIAAIAIS